VTSHALGPPPSVTNSHTFSDPLERNVLYERPHIRIELLSAAIILWLDISDQLMFYCLFVEGLIKWNVWWIWGLYNIVPYRKTEEIYL